MTLRERLQDAMKEALRARETDRLSTLRLINAAIKDRDIAARVKNQQIHADVMGSDHCPVSIEL